MSLNTEERCMSTAQREVVLCVWKKAARMFKKSVPASQEEEGSAAKKNFHASAGERSPEPVFLKQVQGSETPLPFPEKR